MHQIAKLHLAALIAALVLTISGRAAMASGQSSTSADSEAMMCGPNSLYLLLRLNGIQVQPHLLTQCTPTDPRGLSMSQLQEASRLLGLPAQVRQCSLPQLAAGFDRPVIAYTRTLGASPEARHYIVVFGMHGPDVNLIDSTSGRIWKTTIEKLQPFWLGYVLMPDVPGRRPSLIAAIAAPLWITSGLAACCVGTTALKRAKRPRHQMIALLAIVLVVLSGQSACAHTLPASTLIWRTPQADGINCLYIQLKLLGYPGDYQTLLGQAGNTASGQSMGTLVDLSRRLGFSLAAVKLTAAQLWKIGKPAIVYLEPNGIGAGKLSLFLGRGDGTVALIDGTAVTPTEVDESSFRRDWTGYALISARSAWPAALRRSCTVLIVVFAAAFWLKSFKQIRRPQ